jgi:NAD(P)-dependent dehydrogenase (short-subunit alcohol dehydrogenase family)
MPAQKANRPQRSAIVFGVGAPRGLGAALARRFAAEGLAVVAAARGTQQTALTVQHIRDQGGVAEAAVADVTDADAVALALARAEQAAPLELVVYNVGNNAASAFLDLSAADFTALWRQNALGGFLVAQEAVRRLLPRRQGTLIFTGATASLRARPPFTGFASAKAALRAVAQGLAREYGPAGIHVAHVVIDGVIAGEYAAQHFPGHVAAKGADGLIDPDAIAEAFWQLHRQPANAWTHELDLRPFKEPF